MSAILNLRNYKNKSYDVENIFDDNKLKIDLLKVKRFYKKDDTKILNALLKKAAQNKGGTKATKQMYYQSSKKVNFNQQCISKFRYSNNKASHTNFINLYMPQLNKNNVIEKPELFGDNIDEYKKNMTAKHFKFIISPENQNIDLKVLTETFIKQFNKLYGFDVRWLAVEHNDTDHKHVHLVINGKDKNGRYLNKIDKNFIKYTMRDILSRLCTAQVGRRTYEDIAMQQERVFEKSRVTYLDEKIKGQLSESKNIFFPYKITTRDAQLKRRLDYLEKINLAKKINETYFLKPDWYETLKTSGRYNVFLDIKNEYIQSGKPVKLFTNKDGTLQGVVRKIYNMDDEQIWQNGLVLETANAIYYVPSYKKVNEKLVSKNVEIRLVDSSLEIHPSVEKRTATQKSNSLT